MQQNGNATPSQNAPNRPVFRIRTFGGLSVERDGSTVEALVGQRKRLALLALLAAGGHEPIAKDRILAFLWPDSDTDQARNSLNQLAFGLRRVLGTDAIIGGSELRLNPTIIGSDYADFQRALEEGDLEVAAASCRGRFLDGFYLRGAKAFEEWTEAEARKQTESYQSVLQRLAGHAWQAGDLTRAVELRRRLASSDPLSARFARGLIEALAAKGDREAAIRHGGSYLALVRSELDAEPDSSVSDLVARLRETSSPARAEPSESGMTAHVAPGAAADPPTQHEAARSVSASRRRRLLPTAVASAIVALPVLAIVAWPRHPETRRVSGNASTDTTSSRSVATAPVVAAPTEIAQPESTPTVTAAVPEAVPPGGPLGGRRRVLVASFDNETGDSSLTNVGALAADWISQGIQQTGMATVVDPLSTLAAMRRRSDDTVGTLTGFSRASLMARDAGADVVVWGAVYRQADSLVFRARISDVSRAKLLTSIGPIASPLAKPMVGATRLRARVAGALAALTDRAYASVASPSSPAPTFEAYAEYMSGLALFQQFKGREARDHFAAAARIDPTFVAPLVWSALSFDNDGNARARDSLVQLLADRRDRGPLEGYALDYFRAEQHKDRASMLIAARGAAQLTPGSNWSHYAGSLALSQNRLREASRWFAQIDPERGWVQNWAPFWESSMTTAHLLGDFDAEADLARRGLAIGVDAITCRRHVLFALIGKGQLVDANAALEDIVRGLSAFTQRGIVRLVGPVLIEIAQEYRAHGFTKEAKETLARADRWFRSPEAEDLVRTSSDTARLRVLVRGFMASALYEAERYDEAAPIYASLDSANPEMSHAYRGLIAAHRGDRASAEAAVATLDSLDADPYDRAFDQARILCVLGESARAMRKLEFVMSWQLRAFVGVHRGREWDAARANLRTLYDPERAFAAQAGVTQRR